MDASRPKSETLETPALLADPELAAGLRLVVNRLARQLRRHAAADLTPSLVSALVTIEMHGPMTLGQLAGRERVTPPSVTRLVARLEARGLVCRETHAADRRCSVVRITTNGKRLVRHARQLKTAHLVERLERLDEAEVARLRAALPVLEKLLEDEP